MKASDFTNQAHGKIIKKPQGYLAFVPAPLPPVFDWSDKLVAALSKADRTLAKLAAVGNAFPVPHIVTRSFTRKEAVLSSQIEGTRTTFQELLSYESGQLSLFRNFDDAREVLNYVNALDYGIERLESLPLSIRLIREIHEILMKGVRGEVMTPGEIRRGQNWIGRPGDTLANARYVPPPPAEMDTCLSELERFIHADSELPPLLRIGMIHYQFEAIHPFMDGNGRIGRLLVTLLLIAWNLLDQPLLYLSSFIENNRQEYYDRLLAVSQRGAWEAWLSYFLDGVHNQAEDANQRILHLQELRHSYHKMFASDRTADSLVRMVDYLIGSPITSISQAQENLNIGSYNAARRQIEKLEALGIIREVTDNKRNRIYHAEEILRVLEERL